MVTICCHGAHPVVIIKTILQHLTVERSEIIKCVSWAFLRLVSAASVARQSVFAANRTWWGKNLLMQQLGVAQEEPHKYSLRGEYYFSAAAVYALLQVLKDLSIPD
eukprot:5779152-Pleurochrysis_carterae.AAC.1